MDFLPVEAKLYSPAPRKRLVWRGELVDRLREADAPLVLVTAPAGYGKSTLLGQWAEEDARPFIWLSLDRFDNDPRTLVSYLVLALGQLEPVDTALLNRGPDDAESESDPDDTGALWTATLPGLGHVVAALRTPFVLVLDDAHVLTSPQARDVLAVLAGHLPAGSQLAVAGRRAPDLPWGRHRCQRGLMEITAADLRLSPAEVRELVSGAGVQRRSPGVAISADQVNNLLETTEGWAAGVYLTAASTLQGGDRPPLSRGLPQPDGPISDFLNDEVFRTASPETMDFLTHTSILASMCGPLCDEMLSTDGSGARLRELSSSGLFLEPVLEPVDTTRQWYRYHPLFRQALAAELRRREPRVITTLHSRACRWFEGQGMTDEAVDHARFAGEVDRAANLVWSSTARLIASGRRDEIQRWLEGFRPEEVLAHAGLSLAAAWCAAESGRPAEHWIEAAQRGNLEGLRSAAAGPVAAAVALLRAMVARQGIGQMAADAELAERLQTPDDLWRPMDCYLGAVAAHLRGEAARSARLLEAAEQLSDALGLPAPRMLCLGQRAILAIEASDWAAAAGFAAEARSLLDASRAPSLLATATMGAVRTVLLAQQGSTDQARRSARECMRVLAPSEHIAPWAEIQLRNLLARAQLMLGDTAAARVLLSESQNQLRLVPDAIVLREQLDQAWRTVEQLPLVTGIGPSALTTAEMRVLQFLPTHLSFEQIGRRLHITRNTVKTQVISVYRKLGVASRSDAVERGAALGIIDAAP